MIIECENGPQRQRSAVRQAWPMLTVEVVALNVDGYEYGRHDMISDVDGEKSRASFGSRLEFESHAGLARRCLARCREAAAPRGVAFHFQ